MLLSYSKVKEIIPAFNERSLTAEDFSFVTESDKIDVCEIKLKKRGYYVWDSESDYIFLKKTMSGLQWLETAWHECFHALFRDVCEFLHTKRQIIARAFAIIAIIPLPLLKDKWTFLEENPTRYARTLFNEREKILFLYGI